MLTEKESRRSFLKIGAAVAVAVAGVVAGVGGWFAGSSGVSEKYKQLTDISKVTLPAGVVQLTGVIPGVGARWANADDLPLGPVYLLSGDGRLLGIEYAVCKDTHHPINEWGTVYVGGPIPGASLNLVLKDLPVKTDAIGKVADHVDFEYLPNGNEDFPVTHYSVRIYFASKDEVEELTPPSE